MKWTTDKPTTPGWYWMLYNSRNKPECVWIKDIGSDLKLISISLGARLSDPRLSESLWAGPIPQPED